MRCFCLIAMLPTIIRKVVKTAVIEIVVWVITDLMSKMCMACGNPPIKDETVACIGVLCNKSSMVLYSRSSRFVDSKFVVA